MENKSRLRENAIVLIVFGILNVFMFVATVVKSLVDGTLTEGLANIEPDILVAVKVVLVIIGVLMTVLAAADLLLGIKALKVSKNPDASKTYITIAKIFLILSAIGVVTHAISIFNGTASSAIDAGLNTASATLSVCVYALFINSAEAVRKDYLNGVK